jgi:hypothetical protein
VIGPGRRLASQFADERRDPGFAHGQPLLGRETVDLALDREDRIANDALCRFSGWCSPNLP